GMAAFDEETFGPLATLTKAESADDAIELANNTRFGLGASICTQNIDLAKILAQQIDDGAVFINELVKSDPRLPFGGTKISGYGRELGPLGIKEFVNAKTYYVK
ncbi:MAG TPA: aldehyde dehydrogenase family protein, partial [Cryomorphaceae bacterium]|nr:aldehyde dehydrogenase family protein [Cryomorphaceae bacterium]